MKHFLIAVISALFSAFLLTLASPGYSIVPLAYVALVPLLIAISLTERGFFTGWLFGSFYFLFNLHWVINAVSEFGEAPYAVGIIVTILFACLLGVFWGVFGWIYRRKVGANLLLAGVLVALEVAKSTIFTGLPMLNLAHTQYTFPPAIQIAEVTGEFGISLIIAYVNISIASLITHRNKHSVIFAALVLLASLSFGFLVSDRQYAGTNLKVRLIQPAYSQKDKWVPEKKYDIMALVNQMVRKAENENYDLLMLPETVYPAFLNPDFGGYHVLDIAGEKVPIISGGIRYDEIDGKKQYFNSAFMFSKGEVSIYNKLHLVPFGEYFPFKTLFKPIDYYFFQGAEDFQKGEEAVLFIGDKFSAAPMICYESMYSKLVRNQVMLGSDMLTVVTNDSWFGNTSGPYQHLATDVLRAVEFRKPLLRAAQTGISACIDAGGNVTGSLPLGEKGYLDCEVTTHKGLTMFATGGYGWLAAFLLATWYINRRKERSVNSY
ncbi:MAG: apolipoprotein N-acyltransferase [Denitrovibrio sp.]|nr:MAG: apolipoprotein N-acyltransferase [Denitrovibrio sp.]